MSPATRCLTRAAFALTLALVPAIAPAASGGIGRFQPAWPGLANSSSYTPVCNRLDFPQAGIAQPTYTSALGHIFCVSPSYATSNIKFLFVNFYVNTNGAANPETCPGNSVHLDFVTVFIGGTAYPVTFGGAQGITIPDCGFVWTDPLRASSGAAVTLAASTQYYIRTSKTVPVNGAQVASYGIYSVQPRYSNGYLSDGVENTTAVQTSLRLSGTVPAFQQGSNSVGPAMAVGTGWDGSAVYGLIADSIGFGQADLDLTSPGVGGYIARGLNDSTNSSRRNFFNLGAPGTAPDWQSSIATGQFALRMKALRSIPNQPFNYLISEMGQNSPSIFGSSLAAFQTAELDWWRFWRQHFPNTPFFQTTFPPHAGSINNTKWTTQAGQTTDFPAGIRWQADNWLRGKCPGTAGGITCPAGAQVPNYVTVLDVTPAFQDPVNLGNWKTSTWAGTINTAVSSGSTVSIAGPTAPTIGDVLVVEPGTANVDALPVYSMTGSGPWTVLSTASVAHSHAAGAAAAIAYTLDGTHPSATLHKSAAALIETYKSSGVLP